MGQNGAPFRNFNLPHRTSSINDYFFTKSFIEPHILTKMIIFLRYEVRHLEEGHLTSKLSQLIHQ